MSSNITSLISPGDPWYIKASLRISYDKVFDSLSPINNKITGARVKPVRENVMIKFRFEIDFLTIETKQVQSACVMTSFQYTILENLFITREYIKNFETQ